MDILTHYCQHTAADKYTYQPVFYRLQQPSDQAALQELLQQKPYIRVFDEIERQLAELMKSAHPGAQLGPEQLQELAAQHLQHTPPVHYGVWVYYPWSERLVHILDEAEFIAMRTSRNLYKITPAEREQLAAKTIGVIGLSVGQSAALTLALERIAGSLRIADHDELDLSNMNRLRTGVHHLGIPKTVIAAREIAEIDPFLKVTCFHEGITSGNIDAFLTENGPLDLLVEECDALDIKILARQKARALGMPVVMDTSDRGMMDIERFDQEPARPLLHGLMPELGPEQIAALTPPQRLELAGKLVNINSISDRLRQSVPEIGKTITTWPQLASEVMLGGAAVAHVCREICLGSPVASGRYYVDLAHIFSSPPVS